MSSVDVKPPRKATIKDFLVPDLDWEKGDLLVVAYWARQIVSVVVGVLFGVVGFTGIVALAAYALMSVAVVHVYLTSILKIDATDYGSDGDLVKEGFMSGLATFLFLWISVYSFLL